MHSPIPNDLPLPLASLLLHSILLASTLSLLPTSPLNHATAQDTTPSPNNPVFSGPQSGEPLPPFSFLASFAHPDHNTVNTNNQSNPKNLTPLSFNPVEQAKDSPLLLIFVHDVNRQSIAMTRVLANYAHSRQKDGLHSSVIFLGDDTSGTQANIKRIQHALSPNVTTGVSTDGREGPGTLGLNRNVQLTILVSKEKKITANFALVQPSLQADLLKVVRAIIEQVGGPEPKLSDLITDPSMAQTPNNPTTPTVDAEALRALLRPLIQKDASDEQVDEAAINVEQAIADSTPLKNEIGRIARTIVSSGKLENYGTPRAQEILKIWSEKYGNPPR
jgi:hypothetical protein